MSVFSNEALGELSEIYADIIIVDSTRRHQVSNTFSYFKLLVLLYPVMYWDWVSSPLFVEVRLPRLESIT